MTIAAKLFLTCVVLLIIVTIAVLIAPKRGFPGKLETFLGFLVVCFVVGMPASAIAWIWGW